jgi:hypothetical protein
VWGDDGTPDALINVRLGRTSALNNQASFFLPGAPPCSYKLRPILCVPNLFRTTGGTNKHKVKAFPRYKHSEHPPYSPSSIATNCNNVCTTFTLRSSHLSSSKSSNALANRYNLLSKPITNTYKPIAILRQIICADTRRTKASSQPGLTHLHQRDYPAQPFLDIQLPKSGSLRGSHTTKAQRLRTSILLLWSRRAGTTTRRQGH